MRGIPPRPTLDSLREEPIPWVVRLALLGLALLAGAILASALLG